MMKYQTKTLICIFTWICLCKFSLQASLKEAAFDVADCTPGSVQNLKASVTDRELILTWDPPKDQSCIADEYYVSWTDDPDEEVFEVGKTSYNTTLPKYCTSYTYNVLAVAKNVTGTESSVKVDIPVPIPFDYYAEIVAYAYDHTRMQVVWAPEYEIEDCVNSYQVIVQRAGHKDNPIFVEDDNIIVQFDAGCNNTTYAVTIAPAVNTTIIGKTTIFEHLCG